MRLKQDNPFTSHRWDRGSSCDEPRIHGEWVGVFIVFALAAGLWLSTSSITFAADFTDVGYSALQAELGAGTPTGAGVHAAQVEAPINDTSGGAAPIFMPNPSDAEFSGKAISAINGNPSGSFSSHATVVGRLFYGNTSSIAPGISQIAGYDATSWFNGLSSPSGTTTTAPTRITNHSWVGAGDTLTATGQILRLVDRQVHRNESIQIVGLANASADSPLLGSGYNVISVGRTDGGHQRNTVSVSGDSFYGTVRTAPHLVAPESTTSNATPVVSAAAALLVQTGHEAGPSLSDGSTTISGVGTIYNAERSETIKATLMAGADRDTANRGTTDNITDYHSAGHETANGLDDRYGAGQVNILNSYHILAGGEQPSLQEGGSDIDRFGFDYAEAFGGLNGSPPTASYFFSTATDVTLFSSLAWNVGVSNDSALTTSRHRLNLSLFDITAGSLLGESSSALDNTQNLYMRLLAGRRYELRVTAGETGNFSQDYALAWRMEVAAVPLPAAAWLFGSGVVTLMGLARRQGTAQLTSREVILHAGCDLD